jgi:hypothetical protein
VEELADTRESLAYRKAGNIATGQLDEREALDTKLD